MRWCKTGMGGQGGSSAAPGGVSHMRLQLQLSARFEKLSLPWSEGWYSCTWWMSCSHPSGCHARGPGQLVASGGGIITSSSRQMQAAAPAAGVQHHTGGAGGWQPQLQALPSKQAQQRSTQHSLQLQAAVRHPSVPPQCPSTPLTWPCVSAHVNPRCGAVGRPAAGASGSLLIFSADFVGSRRWPLPPEPPLAGAAAAAAGCTGAAAAGAAAALGPAAGTLSNGEGGGRCEDSMRVMGGRSPDPARSAGAAGTAGTASTAAIPSPEATALAAECC